MFKSILKSTMIVLSAIMPMSDVTAAVGRTPGSFEVLSTGAASYHIPLWVPPGPAGMQPKLALAYNSRGPNGPMGPGWSVSGFSAITRCNKTFAQDGASAAVTLTYGDAFCLDGKRLRLTSSSNLATYGQDGTTYQTEVADFANVTAIGTAGNGPSYFTVRGQDGLTHNYGNGGNSQVLATGSSTASAWLLSKISDRANNSVVISYLAPGANRTGSTVPSTISWSPTSPGAATFNYSMQFLYTSNTPQNSVVGYIAGTSVFNQDLLTNISIVNASGTTIKQYVLGYDTSPTTEQRRLTSVVNHS